MATTMDRPDHRAGAPGAARRGRPGRWSSTGRRSARSGSWPSPASCSWGSCSPTWSATSRCTWAPRTSTTTASSSASCSCRSCPAPSLLWLLRIGLIVAFVLHIHAAYGLTRMNHRANGRRLRSRAATGRPPTSPAARCAGPASSSASSSSSTWPTSPGAPPTPTSCGATSYRNFVATFSRPARGRHLPRRQPRPRHPPVPRRLVDVPEPRAQQPPLERLAARLRHRLRRRDRGHERQLPDRGDDRAS